MKKRGRPSKFTEANRKTLIDAIAMGLPYADACTLAGLSDESFRTWKARGEREQQGEYFEFFQAVKKAEVLSRLQAVAAWRRQFGDDFRAPMEFLARRDPENWAETRKVKVAVEQEQEAMLERLRAVLPADLYRQVLEGLADAGCGPAAAGETEH